MVAATLRADHTMTVVEPSIEAPESKTDYELEQGADLVLLGVKYASLKEKFITLSFEFDDHGNVRMVEGDVAVTFDLEQVLEVDSDAYLGLPTLNRSN